MGWLLSATLARRQNDIARAALHIAEAEKRAPGDPNIALEAGNIAGLQGRLAEAREKWSAAAKGDGPRSEEHTSELQSLMRISYAVFCLKKKKITPTTTTDTLALTTQRRYKH